MAVEDREPDVTGEIERERRRRGEERRFGLVRVRR
jgi:hypothetical protein